MRRRGRWLSDQEEAWRTVLDTAISFIDPARAERLREIERKGDEEWAARERERVLWELRRQDPEAYAAFRRQQAQQKAPATEPQTAPKGQVAPVEKREPQPIVVTTPRVTAARTNPIPPPTGAVKPAVAAPISREALIDSKIAALDPKAKEAMYKAWAAYERERPQREAAQKRVDDDMIRELREIRAELDQLEADGQRGLGAQGPKAKR